MLRGDNFVSFLVQIIILPARTKGVVVETEADTDGARASLSHLFYVCALVLLPFQIVGPRLPMDPQSEALFTETSDGLILCKLINLAEFDTIDPR